MAELRHLPPGRAGRLWLDSRLRAGRRAADLLNRKLAILQVEQERLRLLANRAKARWQASWREADGWMLRGVLLSGPREVRLSATAAPAHISVSWSSVMGVRYPLEITCQLPSTTDADRGPGSVALVAATTAYEEAVAAAVAYAGAATASRTIDTEVTTTRRRLRAINDRWLPRLERALRDLTRDLEETERSETFRLRWAAGAGQGASVPGAQDACP